VFADVSHDDGGAPDPGALADAHELPDAGLVANGLIGIGRAVGGGSARHVHARGEQDVRFEVDQAEMAPWPDVDAIVQPRTGLAEERAELHGRRAGIGRARAPGRLRR
jgi:hypothetical protein